MGQNVVVSIAEPYFSFAQEVVLGTKSDFKVELPWLVD